MGARIGRGWGPKPEQKFRALYQHRWLLLSMHPNRIRRNSPATVAAARQLRKNQTEAERRLWQALRQRQLNGLKFRRQHPIDSFIVDFYCPQCRLVIELDGEMHDQQTEYDQARTEQLQRLGCRVLRFRNQEVTTHLEAVLQQILVASNSA